MTAYSFGARWVGIIAMRDSPSLVPEPLHKMAQRLQKKAVDRPVRVDSGRSMPAAAMLRRLASVRARYAQQGNRARADECLRAENLLRRGSEPPLRPWLRRELAKPATTPGGAKSRSLRTTAERPRPQRPRVAAEHRETGWGDSYPVAPLSPWLPSLPTTLREQFRSAGISLSPEAEDWIRWALLHKSYLYESIPDLTVSAGTLELLQILGRDWTRLALLELARDTRGEFSTNDEASKVLAQDAVARSAIGKWLLKSGAPLFGKGEASNVGAGSGSRAPEDVAMQVLGALALTSASTTAPRAALAAAGFAIQEPEPDWQALVRKAAGTEPTVSFASEGPDNARTFTATVTAARLSAVGTGRSKVNARYAAHKAWVHMHSVGSIPATSSATRHAVTPTPFRVSSAHQKTIEWSEVAFGARVPALFSQALTHRSWVHENKRLVAAASQRDYGVLATEGAEILRTLVHHHYVVRTLSTNVAVKPGEVIAPSVTDERTAELYDEVGLDQGVLRSSGLSSAPIELKSDVVQALAGAAWRGTPGGLARRQFPELASWTQSFVARRDTTTALQEYGAVHGIQFAYDFETRGPDHGQEFRATVSIAGDAVAALQGDWASGKTRARHSASGRLLGLLSSEDGKFASDEAAIVRACVLAELRAADPEGQDVHRDLVVGRLGIDALVAGDFEGFERWGDRRAPALPTARQAVVERASSYYKAALGGLLRQRIRGSILPLLPKLHGDDLESRITRWAESESPARLALLEELLGAVVWQKDAQKAVAAFVQAQALVVAARAGTRSEAAVSDHGHDVLITVKVEGVAMESVATPLVDVVGALVPTASWVFDGEHFAVAVPGAPDSAPQLAQAGYAAMAGSFADPWLGQIQSALHALLDAVENADEGIVEALLAVKDALSEPQPAVGKTGSAN